MHIQKSFQLREVLTKEQLTQIHCIVPCNEMEQYAAWTHDHGWCNFVRFYQWYNLTFQQQMMLQLMLPLK